MGTVNLEDLQVGEIYEVDCGDRGEFQYMSVNNTSVYERVGCPFVCSETEQPDFLFGKQRFMYLGIQERDDYFEDPIVMVDLLVLIEEKKGYLNLLLNDPNNFFNDPVQTITKLNS